MTKFALFTVLCFAFGLLYSVQSDQSLDVGVEDIEDRAASARANANANAKGTATANAGVRTQNSPYQPQPFSNNILQTQPYPSNPQPQPYPSNLQPQTYPNNLQPQPYPNNLQPQPYPNNLHSSRPVPNVQNAQSSLSVSCFTCSQCEVVYSNTPTKQCPLSFEPGKQRTCVTYSEKYAGMSKPLLIRGCASERGNCDDLKRSHSLQPGNKLVSCHECRGDLCNASFKTLPNITLAMLTLAVTSFFAKRIFS